MPKNTVLPQRIQSRLRMVYRRAQEAGLAIGRPRKVLEAASVYAVCRMEGVPLTLDEVAKLYGYAKPPIARTYRVLARRVGLRPAVQRPEDYILRHKGRLGRKVAEKALEILSTCNAVGRKPAAVAAAAAYLASNGRLRLHRLAKIFLTTTVTIRAHVKWLRGQAAQAASAIPVAEMVSK